MANDRPTDIAEFRNIRIVPICVWILITISCVFTLRCLTITKQLPCSVSSVICCLILAVSYIGSLYVWKIHTHRDHPEVIKRRFISVFVITAISPIFTHVCQSFVCNSNITKLCQVNTSMALGLRWSGFISAILFPSILTLILFAGPICESIFEKVKDSRSGLHKSKINRLIWIRNHIIAPFSEEFIFRACMLPLVVPCLGISLSIFVSPMFFGVAHFHHLIEKLKQGVNIQLALAQAVFQFLYTTVFGAYSAFLFLRTGHFVAPFIVHAICNHFGVPDFSEVLAHKQPLVKVTLCLVYVFGLGSWCYALYPITRPALYDNNLYWNELS